MSEHNASIIQIKRGLIAYPQGSKLYLNVTNSCSLRCRFCPKFTGSWRIGGHYLRLATEPELDEILAVVGGPRNYDEVVFSGLGEPTMRLYTVLEAGKELRRLGGYVRLETDGLANLRFGRDITPDLEGNIDALSVSIQAANETIYNEHCRPKRLHCHAAALDFADLARDYVPSITLTAIKGLAGVDIPACEATAEAFGVNFHKRNLGTID
ncbi:TatD family nuclease-associated radical SAM protein [Thermithiobacillus plumbiphilus]|uniref:TatD family nuclease-associated radical SAM protein n=1 Tax=Thermithiobacillus plumbiphilus TaxID=1729899 RepID=A0ABU9D9Q1_9PROT